jgi:hypothetical protein
MSQNVELQFKKKDPSKGYAVGTILVGELTVPVIIREFELFPFDVVYKDGIPLPLTEETLGALVQSGSAFKNVVQPDSSENQLEVLFEQPLVDLQPAPRIGKYASMIDIISDTITREHKKELLEKISSDESIKAGFVQNGTVDVLAKIASVKPKNRVYFKESLSKVLPRDIHYLVKEGRFKYKLILGNSLVYDPIETELDTSQAENYEKIRAVGKEMEKKAVFSSTSGAAYEIEGQDEKLLIMNVDGMRKFAYYRVPVSSEKHCEETFGGEIPQLHDFGVWTNGNKATRPFEIIGMVKSARLYELTGFDGTSAKTYIPLRTVDEITPHEERPNTFYVPTSYRFVKVGEQTKIESGKEEKIVPANYYTKDDVGLFNLQGPVFEKYSQLGPSITSVTLDEAR